LVMIEKFMGSSNRDDAKKEFHDYIVKTFSITKEEYEAQKEKDGIKSMS